ncbi:MAG: amidohydrolase [Pseudomonadales bacterium]|nr:amidohydrolase [Pseudomonadales bacterium]MCP5183898.1 amidohydrolase [Pseudomonadales bacterium]
MRRILLLMVPTLLVACGAEAPEPEAVDMLFVDGRIYPMAGNHEPVQALAVRNGRIVALGTTEGLRQRYQGAERNLAGAMLLPGFHDAHVHPQFGGQQLLGCNLAEATSVQAIVDTVAACVNAAPPGGWVKGRGWNLSLFENANPSKALLDAVSQDRAVFLIGADGHSAWVNSEALRRAEVTASTPDPENGHFERDANGEPSGTLRETAQFVIERILPPATPEAQAQALAAGLEYANRHGITSLIDASVGADEVAAYRALEAAGTLHVRAVLSINVTDSMTDGTTRALIDASDRRKDALVRVHAAKVFVDGVLEGESAALLEPYASGHTGYLNMAPPRLQQLVGELDAAGIQIHMHAIGDRAVRAGLDAIAAARATSERRDNRHHIAHLQLVHPDDWPRFAALDVTANFQATWAFPDGYITDVNLPAVGQARVDRMYPIGSMHQAGARLAGGSDWPVSTVDPLVAIETAVTRQDAVGNVQGVLNAAEAVGLGDILEAYTTNGAWLMSQEDRVGRLAPGYLADLVVLDKDLFAVPVSSISEARVLSTWLAGKEIYTAP